MTITRLTAKQAVEEIHNGALLIDVRSEASRHRDGEVQGAVIVPKPEVAGLLTQLIAPKTSGQKTVIFCGSIKGSGPVIEQLQAAGVPDVFDVDGGFAALTGVGGLLRIERAKTVA